MRYVFVLTVMGIVLFLSWIGVDERVGLSLVALSAIALVITGIRRK